MTDEYRAIPGVPGELKRRFKLIGTDPNSGENLYAEVLALEAGSIGGGGGGPASSVTVADGTIGTQLLAVDASGHIGVTGTFWPGTQPVSGTFWQATQPVSGTFWQATQPVSIATMPTTPVTGTFWQATQPVSLTTLPALVASSAVIGHVIVDTAPTTAVTGTFWQATQPVSGTFWQATQPVSGTVTANVGTGPWPVTDNAGSLTVDAPVATPVAVRLSDGAAFYNAASGAASTLYKGRVSTFRTPGRAGTTGQKIFALHNATGSAVHVRVKSVSIDLVQTVVKAITVLPPVIRLWKVTVLPTNGTALTKVPHDSTLTSSASVTVFGDASADGTGSGTTLTATLPAGTIITQEYAPRLLSATAVGDFYEPFDRTTFLDDTNEDVILNALEGVVLFIDYTLATQNPTTDMWIATCHWEEY